MTYSHNLRPESGNANPVFAYRNIMLILRALLLAAGAYWTYTSIEGLCVVSFVVSGDGSISDAGMIKDIGGGCGNEAIRLVNTMPRWTPGERGGKKVRVRFSMPVRFKLD